MRESGIDRCVLPALRPNGCGEESPASLSGQDVMPEILRAGAQKILAQMIQQEVDDWLFASAADEQRLQQQAVELVNSYLATTLVSLGVTVNAT